MEEFVRPTACTVIRTLCGIFRTRGRTYSLKIIIIVQCTIVVLYIIKKYMALYTFIGTVAVLAILLYYGPHTTQYL